MSRPSKVWILGLSTQPERYNNYCLLNAFTKHGIEVEFIDLNRLYIMKDGNTTESIAFQYNDLTVSLPDLCVFADPIFYLPRPDNFWFKDLKEKLDILYLRQVHFLNDYLMHIDAGNKVTSHKKLEASTIPIPKTTTLIYSASEEEISDVVNKLGGYPIVLKEQASAMGRGVSLCYSLEDVQLNLNNLFSSHKHQDCPLLAQEHVNMGGVLICARVVGDEVFPRFTLGSPYVNNEFKSNLRSNKTNVACKVSPELYDICMKTVKATGLDTARLDIFVGDNGFLICEVNSIGSILGGEMAWNVDIADKIANLALSKYGYSL